MTLSTIFRVAQVDHVPAVVWVLAELHQPGPQPLDLAGQPVALDDAFT